MVKLKIRKGDKVVVTTGKDKGKSGVVLRVFPADLKLLVSGINMVKRHTKPTRVSEGGIIAKEAPLHISNVALADPKTGQPSKVAIKIMDDGSKVRVSKKSGEVIRKEGE